MTLLLFTFLALFRLVGSGDVSNQKIESPQDAARTLVENLAGGKFHDVWITFDRRMKSALSEPTLRQTWETLTQKVGTFDKIENIEIKKGPAMLLATVNCHFERTSLALILALNEDGTIAGLHVELPSEAPGWVPPDYAVPQAFSEEQVVVQTQRWQLPGIFSIPHASKPVPAVVLLAGSGPQDQDETLGIAKPLKDLAFGLASRNIAVLRFVKRTMQYPGQVEKGFTVKDEVMDDAISALRFLESRPEVDHSRIFLLGHSLGGMLAPRIASEHDVSGIILMAAVARPFEKLILEQVIAQGNQEQIEAVRKAVSQIDGPALKPDDNISMLGTSTPGSYWLDLRAYKPPETAARLKSRILVLQGDVDIQVTPRDYEQWQKALARHKNASFHLYQGLNHLFISAASPRPNVAPEVVEDISHWILGGQPN
jgi:dienelactone hydrolase